MRASLSLLLLSFALLTACEMSHTPATGSDAGADTASDAGADTASDAGADASVEPDAAVPVDRCRLPDAGPTCAGEEEACTTRDDCCNSRHSCLSGVCRY